MRLLLSALLCLPLAAHAQALTAALFDVNGPSEATAKKALKALDSNLKSLAGATVRDPSAFKRGAKSACSDDCNRAFVRSLDVPVVALLELKGSDSRVVFDLAFWVDGEKVSGRKGESPLDGLDASLRVAVEQVMPAWLRKGFGALSIQVEGGSVVKVDGRVVAARNGELVAVPSGAHQVDVVFPDGSAMLQRIDVPEATRVPLDVEPTAALTFASPKGPTALRYGSFGLFMAGAGSVAAGFIAGALSRGTGIGLTACDTPDARTCSTLAEAQAAHAEAARYASTGNILLGVGGSLLALGVSLYLVDFFLSR